MIIPNRLKEILEKDQTLDGLVKSVITSFDPILKDNKLFFFEEYTDHGIEHIEMVLKASEFLIPEESFKYIKPKEVTILILAIILHDIGMHTEFATFKAMIEGQYDNARIDVLDKKTWAQLWADYLSESRHWSSKKLDDIFGNPNELPQTPDLSNKDKLSGKDKKLIGEFIRRNHARFAHEIALKGLIVNNATITFGNNILSEQDKCFVGIVARSHGIKVRDTFEYLKEIAYGVWKNPADMNIVFLMVLLRIADYLQIDNKRTDPNLLKLKTFKSPISLKEHLTHLAIQSLTFNNDDPELIYVTCEPNDAQMYVKIQNLINDIQHEFDLSWAVLGETYGFLPTEKPKMKFRRINSNLEHPAYLKKINYVPRKIAFEVNKDLSKLLVAPLYGDNPTYGVRELVQNATDACKERMKTEHDKENSSYNSLVTVSINMIDNESYLFKIKDNGKGMTLDEILNYFLSVGSSFRKTVEWKKEFTKDGKSLVNRNGKFGIGVLAAFLLGEEITVKSKSNKSNSIGYVFTANMDSQFININSIEDIEVGTEIEIQISKTIFEKLCHSSNYNKIAWNDWYIGKKPEIKYLLNAEIQNSKVFFKPTKERKIILSDYDKVQWDYSKEIRSSYDMFVACNDIIITTENLNSFVYNYSDVIKYRPHILISDSQGNLPLSLNRNRLETWQLPFEEELFKDVCIDFVARLLTFPVSLETIKRQSLFPHNADILFLANGFSLDVDYFTSKITNKTLIRILTRNNERVSANSILNQYPNLIIYPQFSQLYGLRGKGEKVVPNIESHVLLRKQRYEEYFEEERRIQQWLKNRHSVYWKDENFVSYSMKNYKSQLSLFEERNFNKIIDQLDTDIQSIQEIPISYLQIKKGGAILNKLFEKYIGNNVIIPYDIEERRGLYPLAFNELEDYMKDYEKNKPLQLTT